MRREWSLHRFARMILKESSAPDPKTLAKEVFRRLEDDPKLQRAALEQALPYLCQKVMNGAKPTLSALRNSMPSDVDDASSPRRTPRTGSWKNQGLAEYWEGWEDKLNERYGIGPNEWTMLGDCGIPELTKKSQYHQHLVASNQNEANAADEWIGLLVDHGVAKIRLLPRAVLRERLGGNAA